MAQPGEHAILLCLKMDRFTAEDETFFQECLFCFGEEMFKFTIVVFTNEDIWKADMEYFGHIPNHSEYMQTQPLFVLDFIVYCSGGKIFFDNRKTDLDMDLQVRYLVTKIDE